MVICSGLSRVSWKLSRTVLRGGAVGNDGSLLDHLGSDGAKKPYLIELADQPLFGFAGLWDGSRREDGTVVRSCTIVTMPGNLLMREIHNTGSNPYRMPAILRPDDHETWLSGGS